MYAQITAQDTKENDSTISLYVLLMELCWLNLLLYLLPFSTIKTYVLVSTCTEIDPITPQRAAIALNQNRFTAALRTQSQP